jgi:hypothetical protein
MESTVVRTVARSAATGATNAAIAADELRSPGTGINTSSSRFPEQPIGDAETHGFQHQGKCGPPD